MNHKRKIGAQKSRVELVAIEMGYGHLRPAQALSDFLDEEKILLADKPPLATIEEQEQWAKARTGYELLSQAGRIPLAGPLLSSILAGVTSIPHLYPRRDLSRHTPAVRLLQLAARKNLGRGLASRLHRRQLPLLTTFFAPAVLSDLHGCERLYCVVTDSDINRVWAPIEPEKTNITYFAPSLRVRRRLKAYGVPKERICVSGYPLPHELVGGPTAPTLQENLRRRLVALDPRGRFIRECKREVHNFLGDLPPSGGVPPHLVFAVGGAGAQSELVEAFLPSLARLISKGKLKLTLVAGLRQEVAAQFLQVIKRTGLEEHLAHRHIRILLEKNYDAYFRSFNHLLKGTDILWTKPSELSFFGALGIPLLFSAPVGGHERYNRRWAESMGVALRHQNLRHTGQWLQEMLKDGTFAGAAWTGYMRMPKFGLYRIVEEVCGSSTCEHLLTK